MRWRTAIRILPGTRTGASGARLVALETYNGVGYANRGKPSPYLWAGTNQYGSGKFVADGVYDASHVDNQPGCAGLILAMKAVDASIAFSEAPVPTLPVLRKGSQGEYVKLLQSKLGMTGNEIDGDFGNQTETMLKVAQAAHHLTVDGVAGPQSWKALA
jgi:peptidoglycan hydrolase-like protein with peptidoglycan-binding domain